MKRKIGKLVVIVFILVFAASGFSGAVASVLWESNEYPLFRNAVLYSDLPGVLDSLKNLNPQQMDIASIGKSAGGRDLLLVTISSADNMKQLDRSAAFMQQAAGNPEAALRQLAGNSASVRIPVFVNASIHGNEISGTDGALMLIKKLQTQAANQEVRKVLDNCIVVVDICNNPDGRVKGVRENSAGFDLNRDYLTQSQPETQAVAKAVAAKWYPTSMVDLHGYIGSGNVLIEPCTPPHNPNYEYDLMQGNLMREGEAMAAEVTADTGLNVNIPAKVWEDGWDDYPPIFTPQFFMYYGTLSHTVEVQFPNEQGLETAMDAAWGLLKFASVNKQELMRKQFEIFARGAKGQSVEKDILFPFAYLVKPDAKTGMISEQAAVVLNQMIGFGITVQKAKAGFNAAGKAYPGGTFIIPMKQSLRGLVNTMLWKAEDISQKTGAMYDISSYSLPVMCGFEATAAAKPFDVALDDISSVDLPAANITEQTGKYLVFDDSSVDAVLAANTLERQGAAVYRLAKHEKGLAAGSFIVENSPSVMHKLMKMKLDKVFWVTSTDSEPKDLLPVTLKKIAVVGDNAGAAYALQKMGFDAAYVSYSDLNAGYDLSLGGYEELVMAGTERGIWSDSEDISGNSYGNCGALRERGRAEVIKFAKAGHDLIGIGFAGATLNREAGRLAASFDYTKDSEGSQTAENGICMADFNTEDPLAFGMDKQKQIFAYSPVWFNAGQEVPAAGSYGTGSFYQAGFWKNPAAASGKALLIRDSLDKADTVLIGFDPAFRAYTPAAYLLLADACYYVGYDGR